MIELIKIHTGPYRGSKKVVVEKLDKKVTRHLRPFVREDSYEGSSTYCWKEWWRSFTKPKVSLISIVVTTSDFAGGVAKTKGVLLIELTLGNHTTLTAFFVVNSSLSYNALFECDWMHSNWCIVYSLYQFLILKILGFDFGVNPRVSILVVSALDIKK